MRAEVGRFIAHLRDVKQRSPHTVSAYQRDLGEFLEYLGPRVPKKARDLTVAQVRGFVAYLYERGLRPSTSARKLAALRSLFNYLIRRGEATGNPAAAVRSPKISRSLPRFVGA